MIWSIYGIWRENVACSWAGHYAFDSAPKWTPDLITEVWFPKHMLLYVFVIINGRWNPRSAIVLLIYSVGYVSFSPDFKNVLGRDRGKNFEFRVFITLFHFYRSAAQRKFYHFLILIRWSVMQISLNCEAQRWCSLAWLNWIELNWIVLCEVRLRLGKPLLNSINIYIEWNWMNKQHLQVINAERMNIELYGSWNSENHNG